MARQFKVYEQRLTSKRYLIGGRNPWARCAALAVAMWKQTARERGEGWKERGVVALSSLGAFEFVPGIVAVSGVLPPIRNRMALHYIAKYVSKAQDR